LIAPFDSKEDFAPGQFVGIDANEVASLLKKSVTGIEGCSKIPFTEPITDIVYPSKSKDGRNIGVLEIRLKDFMVNIGVQIRFENNRIYLYEWGTGVLVTQASVTPYEGTGVLVTQASVTHHNNWSTSAIRKLESKIKKIFKQQFLQIVRTFIHEFTKYTMEKNPEKIPLRTHDNSEIKLAWIHTIYCFWGTNYFKGDMGKMGWVLCDDTVGELTNLLDQVIEDMSPVPERYAFYGWGSSLIVIKHETLIAQLETIKRIIFLMQITQSICLSLSQLESTLNEKIYDIKPDDSELSKGSNTYDVQHSDIMEKLSEIQITRISTFKFLEQFHFSTSPLIQNRERLLREKLGNQWKLDDLEASIINKLNILENTLREKSQFLDSKEQHDSLVKQNTLGTLFLGLTLASIIGILSQLVLLEPVNTSLSKEDIYRSHFLWALLISSVVIAVVVIIYKKFTLLRNKILPDHSRSNGKESDLKTDS
jgi:hypothetical protein